MAELAREFVKCVERAVSQAGPPASPPTGCSLSPIEKTCYPAKLACPCPRRAPSATACTVCEQRVANGLSRMCCKVSSALAALHAIQYVVSQDGMCGA